MNGHLVRRFFGSLSRQGLSAQDAAWVQEQLLVGEQVLWARMGQADKRHACAVARRVVDVLGEQATRPVVAAALLHDVGKIEAGVGTLGRVAATMAGSQASRDQVDSWAGEKGWLGRMGKYLQHDQLGAALLEQAGSDPLTVAWAREHHLPPDQWTIDAEIAAVLKQEDDE